MNNAPGKSLLKVSSILIIIFAGLGIVGLLGLSALISAMGVSGMIVVLAFLVSGALAIVELIAGILGIKNCDKPEKAQTNLIFGVIMIAFVVINAIVTIVMKSFVWWSTLSGLVLPIIYLVGALKNKEAVAK